jgi:flavin reductase
MNDVTHAGEIAPEHFREVMGRFASGVTVITARANGVVRGMTANAFMSGSLEPPLCVVSVAKRAHMHDHLIAADLFAVNILAAGQEALASHFSGSPRPELNPRMVDIGGIPTLAETAARITAGLIAAHDCGDHTIFVGQIRFMAADELSPLLYHAGHYASLAPVRGEDAPMPEFW